MDTDAIILGLVPFEIHGERYYTVYYAHDDDPDTVLQARLPLASMYPHPHVNDRIRVRYLLEVPTRIQKRS